jgi:hypothetical protein
MGTYNTLMGCVLLAVIVLAGVYALLSLMFPAKTEREVQ